MRNASFLFVPVLPSWCAQNSAHQYPPEDLESTWAIHRNTSQGAQTYPRTLCVCREVYPECGGAVWTFQSSERRVFGGIEADTHVSHEADGCSGFVQPLYR